MMCEIGGPKDLRIEETILFRSYSQKILDKEGLKQWSDAFAK